MGQGYILDPRTNNLRAVNVLARLSRDTCSVQDVYNTQITSIEIGSIRTIKDLWDFAARDNPGLLPRGMREPVTDRSSPKYWRADKLPKELLVRAFGG